MTLQNGYAELCCFDEDCKKIRCDWKIYKIDVDNQTIDFELDD